MIQSRIFVKDVVNWINIFFEDINEKNSINKNKLNLNEKNKFFEYTITSIFGGLIFGIFLLCKINSLDKQTFICILIVLLSMLVIHTRKSKYEEIVFFGFIYFVSIIIPVVIYLIYYLYVEIMRGH